MKFKSANIITIDATSKNDALDKIATAAYQMKISTSSSALKKALQKREKEFSTGFENGFAIPHARIKEITSAEVLVIKFKKAIDWKAMDHKLTKVAIVLLIPQGKSGEEIHMKTLQLISQQLLDKKFQNVLLKGKKNEIEAVMKQAMKAPTAATKTKQHKKQSQKIQVVAITACATGIAHTYMAAKKLEQTAAELGIDINVQKNGASGPEDKLSSQAIKAADYVLIASDIFVDDEVFEGKQVWKIPVAKAIKEPKKVFQDLPKFAKLLNGDNQTKSKTKQLDGDQKQSWVYRNILTHVMNGVSHIIPLLVTAGVLLAIGKLLASFTGDIKIADNYGKLYAEHGAAVWFKFVYLINIMGIVTLWLMFPVFGMFTAQSIGGKSAIIPGFLAGIIADGDHLLSRIWRTFNIANTPEKVVNPFTSGDYPFIQMSSGFFGVLVGSILIGYFVKYLNKGIKIKGNLAPLKSILIVPGLAGLVVVCMQVFVVNPPFALLNKSIKDLAKTAQSFVIAFGVVVAICTAFDLGGPINKAAGAIAIGLAADGVMPLTARTLSIVIPPIGLGIATIVGKFIFRKDLYNRDLKIAGRTSIFLGLIAITEGGLPFLFEKPLVTMASSIAGALAGSLFAMLIGVQMWQPLPAIYGWGLVGQAPDGAQVTSSLAIGWQIFFYILAVLLGASITAGVDTSLRFAISKRAPRKVKLV